MNPLSKALFQVFLSALLACAFASRAGAQDPPFDLPPKAQLGKLKSALIETSKGRLVFELYPEHAPWHVANFKYLADKGFFRNLRFHRYESHYGIQGGAPGNDPHGGPGYTLPAEFGGPTHQFGSLGMARLPNVVNPERRSNGSQFHILLGAAPQMDGDYTNFGQLVKGSDVLERLRKGDTIRDVKVFVAAE